MNRRAPADVLLFRTAMDAWPTCCSESLVSADVSLEREFEQRLADCPTLAFRVALGVLRNRAEAEDVAQEALLRAYRNFHRLRNRDRFRGWLARTAWRLALDRIRAAGRRERREQAAPEIPAARTAEELAASREFERQLEKAVDRLPEKLRMVLILSAIRGCDIREVAALLALPEGTDRSSVVTRGADKQAVEWSPGEPSPSSQPILRQMRSSFTLLLADGQTTQATAAADPISGHVLKIEVTLHVLK